MIIPAVAFMEQAIEQLKTQDPKLRAQQLKEFHMLGMRLSTLCHDLKLSGIEGSYLLGVETARVLLSTMPNAVIADITL